MRRLVSGAVVVVAMAFLATGCSKPPEAEIQSAKAAVESARKANAAEYASASLRQAEDAMSALDTELQVQEEKFALFRSYKEASAKAAAVSAAGKKAASDAAAGKEQAKNEAAAAIASTRTLLAETQALLDSAPTGKGTAADIAAMKLDLTAAESTLMEADSAQSSERYKEAKSRAAAAESSIQQVKAAVEAAIAARSGRR